MLTNQEFVARLVGEEPDDAEPSAELIAAAWALPADDIRQLNVHPTQVVAVVLGAAGRLRALRDRIAAQAPSTNLQEFDKLEEYGRALYWSHLQCLAQPIPASVLQALAEEGIKVRRRLRADTMPLCERGLMEAGKLKKCEGRAGYRNIAIELGILETVFREAWAAIQGKCAVEEAELDRARRISVALLRYLGMKEEAPAVLAKARDLRARIFTLVVQCYEQARRAVQYVRYFEKDAEKFAPSVYADRRRRTTGEKDDQASDATATTDTTSEGAPASPPHTETAPPQTTAVASGAERSAAAVPTARANEPFMD